jgi:hypothetical protein
MSRVTGGHMNRKVYLIQPTYRLMDGSLIKKLPLFNYSYNLPILSATIPPEWEKVACLEYSEEVDFQSDASTVVITSTGYDIAHSVEIADKFRMQGKTVLFGAHMDELSDRMMRNVCHSVFYGYPDGPMMRKMLCDAESGSLAPEYRCGLNIDFPFDYSVLKDRSMWFTPALMSIGCRHTCSYCCYPPVFKGRYRLRHVDNVMRDLHAACALHRPIAFLDANLYNNREYLIRVCRTIIDDGVRTRWGGQATTDIGDDIEVLTLMRKAGCRMLFVGLESLDQKNMVQLNKDFDTSRYAQQVARIRKAGICVGAFFMLGLDEDTQGTFDAIYEFFRKTKVEVPYIHILVPVPGTALERDLREQGRVQSSAYDHYLDRKPQFSAPCSIAYYTPKKLTPAELEEGYLRLFQRISTIPKILRRSSVADPVVAALILLMNLEARRKCRAMAEGHDSNAMAGDIHADPSHAQHRC